MIENYEQQTLGIQVGDQEPAKNENAKQKKSETLKESVLDSLSRDFSLIFQKLKTFANPFDEEKNISQEIANWDLWGPFFLILMSSTFLHQILLLSNRSRL